MESFKTLGRVQVAIDDDVNRVISFNPKDRMFRNRLLQFVHDMTKELKTSETRIKELQSETVKDEFGFPINADEVLQFDRGLGGSLRDGFDEVFGGGSSDVLFGKGGFDEEVLTGFMNYVLERVNKVSTAQIEEKLGHSIRKPRRAKA